MRSSKRAIGFLVGLVFGCATITVQAQTFSEWFRQKHTQKKYLLEQIAALKVYTGYVKKGYGIARDGLGLVRDITDGEFKLHELFISGLKKVSPVIGGDVRLAEIMVLELSVLRSFKGLLEMEGLSVDHLDYLLEVKSAVVSNGLADLEELLLVVTSGRVEMTDDQRIARLNGIYERTLERHGFAQRFSGQVVGLLKQMEMEGKSLKALGGFYGKD
ncbi:hypothetical protein [Pedobacter sp.]